MVKNMVSLQTDTLLNMDILPSDSDWKPQSVSFFNPHTIIFAKGSRTTKHRRQFVSKICDCFPDAKILEQENVSHSKVTIPGNRLIDRHYHGKQTLVFGELADSVRYSNESGNSCPNYWHFSPYAFCPYGCHYCYLAGTIGIKFSPSVKIFVNLSEILSKIDTIARRLQKPTAFYLGKLQDGLALDPLTGYSKYMIPFFAEHPYVRLTILTKSSCVDNLLGLTHNGNTILSWSLNPDSIGKKYEPNTPSLIDRLQAMKKCSDAGYPIRAMLMPIIPVDKWQEHYSELIDILLAKIPLQRLTLGGVCSYKTALSVMNTKLTRDNTLNNNIETQVNTPDGRIRYSRKLRIEMYTFILGCIQKLNPELTVSLCMEEIDVVRSVGLLHNIGQCICPL